MSEHEIAEAMEHGIKVLMEKGAKVDWWEVSRLCPSKTNEDGKKEICITIRYS